MSRLEKFFLFFIFIFCSYNYSVFGQGVPLSKIERIENNEFNKIKVFTSISDTIIFNRKSGYPDNIIDSYIDDNFCVLIFKSKFNIYTFSAAYKVDKKWYVDYPYGFVFHSWRYRGNFLGPKVTVHNAAIVDGSTIKLSYTLTDFPFLKPGEKPPTNYPRDELFKISLYGVFSEKTKEHTFVAFPPYINSPREIIRVYEEQEKDD